MAQVQRLYLLRGKVHSQFSVFAPAPHRPEHPPVLLQTAPCSRLRESGRARPAVFEQPPGRILLPDTLAHAAASQGHHPGASAEQQVLQLQRPDSDELLQRRKELRVGPEHEEEPQLSLHRILRHELGLTAENFPVGAPEPIKPKRRRFQTENRKAFRKLEQPGPQKTRGGSYRHGARVGVWNALHVRLQAIEV